MPLRQSGRVKRASASWQIAGSLKLLCAYNSTGALDKTHLLISLIFCMSKQLPGDAGPWIALNSKVL